MYMTASTRGVVLDGVGDLELASFASEVLVEAVDLGLGLCPCLGHTRVAKHGVWLAQSKRRSQALDLPSDRVEAGIAPTSFGHHFARVRVHPEADRALALTLFVTGPITPDQSF